MLRLVLFSVLAVDIEDVLLGNAGAEVSDAQDGVEFTWEHDLDRHITLIGFYVGVPGVGAVLSQHGHDFVRVQSVSQDADDVCLIVGTDSEVSAA